MQQNLFGVEVKIQPVYTPDVKKPSSYSHGNNKLVDEDADKHPEEYCIEKISDSEYLWDLRAWRKDHDPVEVLDYCTKMLATGTEPWWLNDGHAQYCMLRLLQRYGWTPERLTELIMGNLNICFKEEIGDWHKCRTCNKDMDVQCPMNNCGECFEKKWGKKDD